MKLYEFQGKVDNDDDLKSYEDYIEFAKGYLDFIGLGQKNTPNIQADIISVNENNYHFIQYKDDGAHCITRPINTDIFLNYNEFVNVIDEFRRIVKDPASIKGDENLRDIINRVIYTCQMCVGCTLDAFNSPNKARKRNGLLFEILIRSVISASGVSCEAGDEVISLKNNESMKFQHDIVLKREDDSIAGIGQLKTSSKDRIDKIFLDKYMYSRLTKTDIPHFAVFLNDVQRASRADGRYSINSTFLPGHFKAYTMALNPLDGVYYLDMRPSINKDRELSKRIFKFDKFLVEDLWDIIKK